MFPLLFQIGPIPIHTYGVMIAIGFLVALQVSKRLAIASKIDAERLMDFGFWALISGFLGSRFLYVLTRLGDFAADPLAVFRVWEGGLVFFGGPLAALPVGIWYFRKYKLPVWKTIDCIVPAIAIAHAFGRLGCVAAGCCYGKPTGSDWGLKLYSNLVDVNLRGIPLHPTQLYESSSLLVLFLGLLWVFKTKKFDGQVTLTYFMAYPVIRSIVEIYRGDIIRGFIIPDLVSTSQFISGLVFVAAFGFLIYRLKSLSKN